MKVEPTTDQGTVSKIPKNLEETYKSELNNLDNMIIFIEFLKDFMSVLMHKRQFENLLEQLYILYSKMLDDYYNIEDKNINVDNFEEVDKVDN
jgi:hypothetical protein